MRVPDAGLPGIALIEVQALLLLLVLFWHLAKGSSVRFLSIWMAGWAVYSALAASQVRPSRQAGLTYKMLVLERSFDASGLFFKAVLDYGGGADTAGQEWLPGRAETHPHRGIPRHDPERACGRSSRCHQTPKFAPTPERECCSRAAMVVSILAA